MKYTVFKFTGNQLEVMISHLKHTNIITLAALSPIGGNNNQSDCF